MCSNTIMFGVHFIVLKINGVDVINLPHSEAVRMFLNASDPIHIEVCRKRESICKQFVNSESEINNLHELETPIFDEKYNQRVIPTDYGQLLTGLVLYQTCCDAANITTSSTSTINYKRVNSASSATNNCKTSLQKLQQTFTSAKNLSLYFPPSPPITLPLTICDQQCDFSADRVARIGLNSNTNPYKIHRSSVTNITKADDNSKLSINSSIFNSRQPLPPLLRSDCTLPYSSVVEGSNNAGNSSPKNMKSKLTSTGVQTETNDFVHSLFDVRNKSASADIIEQDHNLFEECLAPEIDIEEITLRKSDSNERLGLAFCCSLSRTISRNAITNDCTCGGEDIEICTEVYVSDIQPGSIAARDGRLQQGDQILQVNGKDVTNKKETETLIAENINAVTLLVSRYLYMGDDDFNHTCVAGFDDEDDEDEADDDDEAYYNEHNMAYENSFLTKNEKCYIDVETQLSRSLLESSTAEHESNFENRATTKPTIAETMTSDTKSDENPCKESPCKLKSVLSVATVSTNSSSNLIQKSKASHRSHILKYDPVNHLTIKAHLTKINKDLSILDSRDKSMVTNADLIANDYDTEHIYETIPEDTESEPLYCSPYESYKNFVGPTFVASSQTTCTSIDPSRMQQQKERVAAWLGMQPPQRRQTFVNGRRNNLLHYPYGITTAATCSGGTMITSTSHSKSGTVQSAATTATGTNSSSGFGNPCQLEQENSSSAYNTGGSNNSGTAVALVFNSAQVQNLLEQSEIDQMAALKISKSQRLFSLKQKLSSPKHQSVTASAVATRTACDVNYAEFQVPTPPIFSSKIANISSGNTQQFSSSTMYTNVENLQQTMQLQQNLFRKALTKQQQKQRYYFNLQQQQQLPIAPQQQEDIKIHACPTFTAPNLSHYHFVSSQEVSVEHIRAAEASTKASNEVSMVWKVKRRQDGTRYIVRRPARTRMIRDRALRVSAERETHEATTTEDDTISEIKTGRYWTREERKKHIERARERRQQQQLATVATMRISDRTLQSTTAFKGYLHVTKDKQQHSSGNASQQHSIDAKKLQRQNSVKLQYHQQQFGSTAIVQNGTLMHQKVVPFSITALPTEPTVATNVAYTNTSEKNETVFVYPDINGACTNLANVSPQTTISIANTGVTTGTSSLNITTVGTQASVSLHLSNSGSNIAGLLSVTTV